MDVTEAILSRRSMRGYTDEPVSREILERILTTAGRAPSGGNIQPWRVYVLTGAAKEALLKAVQDKIASGISGDPTEYNVYPPEITDPYRTRRRKTGRDLYETIKIPYDDRAGKLAQFARNYQFFGAPVGMIFTIDRQMEQPGFSDLGMFIQSIMLLAREEGLHSCAQESWSTWNRTVMDVLEIPNNEMVFCGLALGHLDEDAAINSLVTDREPLDVYASFHGF